MRAVVVLALMLPLALASSACREKASSPAPEASSSAAAAASGSAASVAKAGAPAVSWFVGPWQSKFKAELFRIAAAPGAVKEWAKDDGTKASGDCELSIAVAPDGTAQGTAKGALGDLNVTGRFEDDHASLALAAPSAEGFHGVVLLTRQGDRVEGSLSASSGDSLQVRSAKLTLERGAP